MTITRAILKKHWRQTVNIGRIMRTQSYFKWLFVLAFAVGLEAGLFWLFYDGFRFLDSFGGLGSIIVNRLFSLFFLAVGMMLVCSSLVTSYSTVFRSQEIPFLMTRPFKIPYIVSYKFYEATTLSSWAFFFIIIPFVSAYACYERLSPVFALWTFFFSVPFVVLCSGIGTLIVMAVVRWVPRSRSIRSVAIVLLAALFAAGWLWSRRVYDTTLGQQFNVAALIPGLKLAGNMLAPSAWVSEGIMSLASRHWYRGAMLWLVLSSTALVVAVAVEWLGEHVYYEAWQRVVGSQGNTNRKPVLFAPLARWLRFIPHDVRAMALKDIRTFLRDPMQWSQAVIFFGMLTLYFANLRNFRYHQLPAQWRNMIAFLNVFSVSAVVCSFGSRFVFPQLSLEGHGFWVIGLSPTTMKRILWTKFVMAAIAMSVICIVLSLLSSSMLDLSWHIRWAGTLIVLAISTSVCGLSTGLGAVYLDLRQRNPAAIVSGFGGTLNLVMSLTVMLLVILPPGLLFHLNAMGRVGELQVTRGTVYVTLWILLITVIAASVPMRLGIRSISNRDF